MDKIPDEILKVIKTLESRIGYTYKNKQYAVNALVHSSFSNEHHSFAAKNNERLEFLGDAILDAILTSLSQPKSPS